MGFPFVRTTNASVKQFSSSDPQFLLWKADASDPPAKGPPSSSDSSGESPGEGPEDDWKTRWAAYFFVGVLLITFLYFLWIAFSI